MHYMLEMMSKRTETGTRIPTCLALSSVSANHRPLSDVYYACSKMFVPLCTFGVLSRIYT